MPFEDNVVCPGTSISSENLELQGFLGSFSFQWLQIGYTCHLATIRDSSSIDNTFELGSYFGLLIWIQMTVGV